MKTSTAAAWGQWLQMVTSAEFAKKLAFMLLGCGLFYVIVTLTFSFSHLPNSFHVCLFLLRRHSPTFSRCDKKRDWNLIFLTLHRQQEITASVSKVFPFIDVFSPFSLFYMLHICKNRVCCALEWMREKKMKKDGNTSKDCREKDTRKGNFLFWISASWQLKDKRGNEVCRGVKSVHLSKENVSHLQANKPYYLFLFSQFLSLPLLQSLLLEAALPIYVESFYFIFCFHIFLLPTFSFLITCSRVSAPLPPTLSLCFPSLSSFLSCFLPLLSRHFILTFQKRGALSQGKNVSIVHTMFGFMWELHCLYS